MAGRRTNRLLIGVATMFALGCGDETISPSEQNDALATAFDALARQSNQQGDADASLAFAHAAMAVRLGIQPSPIAIAIDDQTRSYQALVHVVRHSDSQTAVSLRTLVAFRQSDPTAAPSEILYLAVTTDSARLAHPATASPLPFAWAVWKDFGKREVWVGTQGKAGLRQETSDAPCPKQRESMNVTCTMGTFSGFLDGDFQQATTRTQVAAEPVMGIRLRAAPINGADLVFGN